ncbi:hypothetical protein MMC07_003283 [Pseudocyphellaria aurata]|nr:hypothetical protein [Pseudocyphellaria aurata]
MPINKLHLDLKLSKNEVFDHVFLATVDRKWIDYLKTKLPNLGVLGFENENRGVPKDDYGNGSPCTIHYLRCIKFNLLAMTMLFTFETDLPMGSQIREEDIDPTYAELERLHEHPELFPTKFVETQFNYDITIICDLLLDVVIPKADELLELQKQMDEVQVERAREVLYPAKDERRTPWQQYLHNNAPGSGIDPELLENPLYPDDRSGMKKITQALPMTAAKIVRTFKNDREPILRELKIKEVPEFKDHRRLTQHLTQEGSLITRWMMPIILPKVHSATAAEIARDREVSGPISLERLSEKFGEHSGQS